MATNRPLSPINLEKNDDVSVIGDHCPKLTLGKNLLCPTEILVLGQPKINSQNFDPTAITGAP